MPYDKTMDAWLKSLPPWGPSGGVQQPIQQRSAPSLPWTPSGAVQTAGNGEADQSPGILQRLLAGLGVAENAVIGGVHGVQEIRQESRSGNLDIADLLRVPGGIASGLKEGIESVVGGQDKLKYGQDVAIGEYAMGGGDPVLGSNFNGQIQGFERDTKNMTAEQYNDYIKNTVKPAYEKYQQSDSAGETAQRMVGGFAADVGFDPLTYVSFGAVPLIKALLKRGAPEVAAKIAGGVEKLAETKPRTAGLINSIGDRPSVIPKSLINKINPNTAAGITPEMATAVQAASKPVAQALEPNAAEGTLFGEQGFKVEGPQAAPPVAPQQAPVPGIQEALFNPEPQAIQGKLFGDEGLRAAGPEAMPTEVPGAIAATGKAASDQGTLFTDLGNPKKAALPPQSIPTTFETSTGSKYTETAPGVYGRETATGEVTAHDNTLFVSPEAAKYVDAAMKAGKKFVNADGKLMMLAPLTPVAEIDHASYAAAKQAGKTDAQAFKAAGGKTGYVEVPESQWDNVPRQGMVPVEWSEDWARRVGTPITKVNEPIPMAPLGSAVPGNPVPSAAAAAQAPIGSPVGAAAAAATPVAKVVKSTAKEVAPSVTPVADAVVQRQVKASQKAERVAVEEKSKAYNASVAKATDHMFSVADQLVEKGAENPLKGVEVTHQTMKFPMDGTSHLLNTLYTSGKNILGQTRDAAKATMRNGGFIEFQTPKGGIAKLHLPSLLFGPQADGLPIAVGMRGQSIGPTTFKNRGFMDTPITLTTGVKTTPRALYEEAVSGVIPDEVVIEAVHVAAQHIESEPVIKALSQAESEAVQAPAEAAYSASKAETPPGKSPEQPAHRADLLIGDGKPAPIKQDAPKAITQPPKLTKAEREQIKANKPVLVHDELMNHMFDDINTVMIQREGKQAWIRLTEKGTPKEWAAYQEHGIPGLAALGIPVSQGVNPIDKQLRLMAQIRLRFFTGGAGQSLESAGKITRNLIGTVPNSVKVPLAKKQAIVVQRAEAAWDQLQRLEREAEKAGSTPVKSTGNHTPMRLSERYKIAAADIGVDNPALLTVNPSSHDFTFAPLTDGQKRAITLLNEHGDYVDGTFDVARYNNKGVVEDIAKQQSRAEAYDELKKLFPSIDNYNGPAKDIRGRPNSEPKIPTKGDVAAEPNAATGEAMAAGASESVVHQINKDAAEQATRNINNDTYAAQVGGADDVMKLQVDMGLPHAEITGMQRFLSWFTAASGARGYKTLIFNNLGVGKRLGGDLDHWLKEITDLKASPEEITQAWKDTINRYVTGQTGTATAVDKTGVVVSKMEERISKLFDKKNSMMSRSQVSPAQLEHYLRTMGVDLPKPIIRGETDNHLMNLITQIELTDNPVKLMTQFEGALTKAMTRNFAIGDLLHNVGVAEKSATHPHNFAGRYFTPESAKEIPAMIKALDDMLEYTPSGKAFFGAIDDIQAAWKTSVTIIRPGHHIRNMTGDLFMSWMSNPRLMGNPGQMIKDYKKAVAVQMDHADWYGGVVRSNGDNIQQMLDMAGELVKGNRAGAVLKPKTASTRKIVEAGGRSLSSSDIMTQAYNRGLLQIGHVVEDIADEGRKFQVSTAMRGLPVIKQLGGLSASREHSVRLMDLIGDLDYGLNKKFGKRTDVPQAEWDAAVKSIADESAKRIRKIHPDGLMLTNQEKNVMRRIMPFYSYTKTIIPSFIELAIQHPGRAVAPGKAYRNAQDAVLGQDTQYGYDVNGPKYPSWVYGSYGMGPLFGVDAESGANALVASGQFGIASADVPKMVADPKSTILQMLSPGLKVPMEIISDHNLQTGQTIDSWGDYAKNNLPVVSDINRGVTGQNAGSKPGNLDNLGWQNWISGMGNTEINKPSYITSGQLEQRSGG